MYHHKVFVDFDHCQKGMCKNCPQAQQKKCEDKLNREGARRTKSK